MSGFWLSVDRFGLALALTGLVAPILGCALGALYGSRRRLASGSYLTGRWAGRGFLVGILTAAPLLFLGMCAVPSGSGVRANDGYRRAEIVLQALEEYRARFGVYPDSLRQLAPTFLADSALAGPQAGYPFELRLVPDGFVLGFRYVRPGMNECRYPSSTKTWTCSGYF